MSTLLPNLPLLTEALEQYATTPEGLPLWKTKGMVLDYENLLENIFVLSSDLADYFAIRHNNLCNQNIYKLQEEGHLSDHLLKIKHMVEIGSSAKRVQAIYALTRHQTEHLIMDFAGPRARQKKHDILSRLQAIEADVLQGAFEAAREKAQVWDGVALLKQHGFKCSVSERLATKRDIATFLRVPEPTLNSFLRRHADQIQPVKLERETIRGLDSKARTMNGYDVDDVIKIAFWMDSEVGVDLKKQMFGKVAALAKPGSKEEIEWRIVLAQVFEGFGLKYNHPVGQYRVDFVVEKLLIALECDADNHSAYDSENEALRDRAITEHYALIRFNSKISLETLFNGILKAKPKEVLRLYL